MYANCWDSRVTITFVLAMSSSVTSTVGFLLEAEHAPVLILSITPNDNFCFSNCTCHDPEVTSTQLHKFRFS